MIRKLLETNKRWRIHGHGRRAGTRRPHARRNSQQRRLVFEQAEDRMMLSATVGLDPPETAADVSGEGGGFIDLQSADYGGWDATLLGSYAISGALSTQMQADTVQGTSFEYDSRNYWSIGGRHAVHEMVYDALGDIFDDDGDIDDVFGRVAPLVEKVTQIIEHVKPIVESVVAAVQPITTAAEPVAAVFCEVAEKIELLAPIVDRAGSLSYLVRGFGQSVTPVEGGERLDSSGSDFVYTSAPRPPAQKIAPDDPAREENGGMIDLTYAFDDPMLVDVDVPAGRMRLISDIAGTDDGAAKVDSLVEQIPLEGSSGRSQAFELAVSPGPVSGLGGIEDYTDGFPSVGSSVDPLARPIFSTDVSRPDTQPAAKTPPEPSRKPSSDDRLSLEHAPADERAAAAVSSHEPSEDDRDAVDRAVFLQTNRRTALVPMLAVAAAAGRLINRWRHPHDDQQTCLVPPRRRRAESA